jgi:type VI protein secretion system component Hcp
MSFMQYRFRNCIIRLLSTLGNPYQNLDLVWMDYGAVQWDYTQQSRTTGGSLGHIVTGWDLQTNSKV